MKFFTRAWCNGEMRDEAANAVPDDYFRYIASLRLPATITALAEINPHDAYILNVENQPENSELTLRLRSGDLQRGYSDVVLRFSEASVDPATVAILRRALRPARVEVLYDEVDRFEDCFEYRLLLFPDGEATIQFHNVSITSKPVASREAE